jgi:uncharacterized repeat protein (TIGR01451 family)
VVPAKNPYTTKITWDDKTPAIDLYGTDLGDTILGTGNPGDALVQFGLHLAVTDKARDGTWGMIKVWNSPTLVDLEKYVRTTHARPGGYLKYTLKVVNKTPVFQPFVVDDPLPANTTFIYGRYYDPVNKRIHWTGQLAPYQTRDIDFWVRINRDIPLGTVITNQANLADGALGDTASTTTNVVAPCFAIADDFLVESSPLFLPAIIR